MFESTTPARSMERWKILVSVGVGASLLMAVAAVVHDPQPQQREELTGILHEEDTDYGWYRDHVNLTQPRLQMAKNLAGNRMAIFSATIENHGEKALDVVEMKMTFFNYDEPVWETTRTPIRPGAYTAPIQPMTKRSFTFYIQDLPKGWMASRAEMDINGFRFTSPR
jgi:hypothetical protein